MAGHVRCARLIEHRAVSIKGNAQRMQEVRRGRTAEGQYHAVEDTRWVFRFGKMRGRPASSSISLMFDGSMPDAKGLGRQSNSARGPRR